MNKQILTEPQIQLLPLIKSFNDNFGLVGGTAVALHLGHRRSIDFDLFSASEFNYQHIKRKIKNFFPIEYIYVQGEGELTVTVNRTKLTCFHFPYPVEFSQDFEGIIKIPDLLTLGAMKAFALGKRAKWKDYVDLFFILNKFSLTELTEKTNAIFRNEFNEKLFRVQISYFEDLDYSEEVNYLPEHETPDVKIKEFLKKISIT